MQFNRIYSIELHHDLINKNTNEHSVMNDKLIFGHNSKSTYMNATNLKKYITYSY